MTVGEFRKVKKFFDYWTDMREIVTYRIVEVFDNNFDTYEVMNLSVDMDDGVIYFYDIEGIILNKPRGMIKNILISSAELVDLYNDRFDIKLKNGNIRVKVIA